MIKLIQRKSDNKYLQSLENDIWVDNISEAYVMNIVEFEDIKKELLKTYQTNDLKEVVDFFKTKEMSKEEKKRFLELFKKNNK